MSIMASTYDARQAILASVEVADVGELIFDYFWSYYTPRFTWMYPLWPFDIEPIVNQVYLLDEELPWSEEEEEEENDLKRARIY